MFHPFTCTLAPPRLRLVTMSARASFAESLMNEIVFASNLPASQL